MAKLSFKKIEAARKKKGHSIEEACGHLKISRSTWDNWRRKVVNQPFLATMERIENYINGN